MQAERTEWGGERGRDTVDDELWEESRVGCWCLEVVMRSKCKATLSFVTELTWWEADQRSGLSLIRQLDRGSGRAGRGSSLLRRPSFRPGTADDVNLQPRHAAQHPATASPASATTTVSDIAHSSSLLIISPVDQHHLIIRRRSRPLVALAQASSDPASQHSTYPPANTKHPSRCLPPV